MHFTLRTTRLCAIALLLLIFSSTVRAQASDTPATASKPAAASPKRAWDDFKIVEKQVGHPWWAQVLLWVPNRLVDLVDVFRVDVGVGRSFGAVARITKYGQAGYRTMSPLSVRFGDFGRRSPILVEHSNELGIGPAFVNSQDRRVCTGEVGAGADLFIVGAYAGICVEELFDFVAGIFFLDPRDDDVK